MLPGEHTLNDIGAVQAVDTVGPEHASLAFAYAITAQEEAVLLEVIPDLRPKEAQSATNITEFTTKAGSESLNMCLSTGMLQAV